jgi:LacI family transcriptional regulator
MKPAITVFELSKILKLSPSTVSRALKNHPDIAPETRQRVLELSKKLDYEPNIYAVSLRTRNTQEFAVIVPSLSGFFYDSFISAVEQEARKLSYSLFILLSGDDPKAEIEHLKVCKQRKVEGIFACITPHTKDFSPFQKLQKLDMPVIFFDKVPLQGHFTKVCVADQRAAELAAIALINSPRKKILSIFGDLNMSISTRRHDTFINTFKKASSTQQVIIDFAKSTEEAQQIVLAAFSLVERPDAVFCMSDEILIGVMKAIQMMQLDIPKQVAVICISNGFFPKLYHPAITYVETSGEKLGKLAFARMLDYINGNKEAGELVVESLLVRGESL